ncbi:hypothetical protein E1A91_A08G159100v1 [Gossypium mustelinum]|uniref:Uncharacterized protein n=1 Tax=Gossypium mustelinum TaxID=34275 RepID=A0A5D2YAH6_GOSMU|nr:hypothetical protein E1A91_A08G159100v1 [Gossypium mustelinum]
MFHQRVASLPLHRNLLVKQIERYGPQDLLTCRHHWCSSNNSFICYKSGSRGRMLARVFPHHSFRRR